MQNNHLFQRNYKNMPRHCAIDDLIEWQTILQQLHNESGLKKQKGTYQQVVDRYW